MLHKLQKKYKLIDAGVLLNNIIIYDDYYEIKGDM